jgi:hypothetical protein
MRVLVCGGRNYGDALHFAEVMDRIDPDEVVCGGASGADEMAHQWAIAHRIDHRVYYAQWRKFDKSAGFIRNQRMLDDARPDLVVAFPGGRGTAGMIALAEKAEIPVQVIPPRYA